MMRQIQIGSFEDIRSEYDTAIRLDPKNLHFRINRMVFLRQRNKYQDALGELDFIAAFPIAQLNSTSYDIDEIQTNALTWININRGLILTNLGRVDEARKAFDLGVTTDPCVLTHAWRAQFEFEHRGDDAKIEDDLAKALAADPDMWLARAVKGRKLLQAKKYDQALVELTVATERFPPSGRLHWFKALTLRSLGRPKEAADAAMTSFLVDPAFMSSKLGMLQQRGYLPGLPPNSDPRPALKDAVTACMLDGWCG